MHIQPRSKKHRARISKTKEAKFATPMADADIGIKPEISHSNTQVKTEDEEAADSPKPQLEGEYFTRSGRQVKVPDRYKPHLHRCTRKQYLRMHIQYSHIHHQAQGSCWTIKRRKKKKRHVILKKKKREKNI